MVQQTLEEWVRGNRESTLMEECQGDNIAVGQRWRLLMAGHKPLHSIGPPIEKTMLDEALYVCMGNIKAVPRIHGGWRWLQRGKGGTEKWKL